jgi:excisionase family DNA binding protein
MSLLSLNPSTPSKRDSQLAKASSHLLSQHKGQSVTLKSGENEAALPDSAVALLEYVLQEMAQGKPVSVLPLEGELSTQQAADILNVSRPFVIKLLDNKALPYRKVGTHRRILLRDVLTYKQKMDEASEAARQALVDQAQELDMGY